MTVDDEALVRLYQRQARGLLTFFQRRVQEPELATDLMADAFTTALERREQFRGGSEEELSGWLWRIAQSVLRDHERRSEAARRGARRLGAERRALSDAEIERIEELASTERLRGAVRRNLSQLPREQQAAVRMRVLEGLRYEEIAARLGISASGTRTSVTRAMQTLRGLMASELRREGGAR
jgi:RNA polymerase sigma-70 factor (ECF subfamily)